MIDHIDNTSLLHFSLQFTVLVIVLIIVEVLTVGFLWIFQSSLLINVDNKFGELWGVPPLPVKPNANISQISSIESWVGG